MNDQSGPSDPGTVLDQHDPGDDTQRRYRYQHAYVVVLLCAVAKSELPYVRLICENHEDILAALPDGRLNAYQVKTRKPEQGPWKLTDVAIAKAIARFVKLNRAFPESFQSFKFVTNCAWQENSDVTASSGERSPSKLLDAVCEATLVDELPEVEAKALEVLAGKCDCERPELFSLLRLVGLVKGPSLDDYETVVSHQHLASTPACSSLTASELNAIRDRVIAIVARASSLSVDEPSSHWFSTGDASEDDPRLRAKIVTLDEFVAQARPELRPFRFAPGFPRVRLSNKARSLRKLERKLAVGGLESQFETFRRRTLSAERHLLKLGYTNLDLKKAEATIDHLDSVVLGVCDDARLEASDRNEASEYGPAMLTQVHRELKQLAAKRPDFVAQQPYECLVGLAGLLTDECRVWWSSEFDVEEAK